MIQLLYYLYEHTGIKQQPNQRDVAEMRLLPLAANAGHFLVDDWRDKANASVPAEK